MDKMILSVLVIGAGFAGFVGTQIAQSAEAPSDQVAMPAKAFDDGVKSFQVAENPVVIELFTSQGCSSCPPADMLASRLAKDSSLLVISRPVTYWDRLGWKDTLAREDNTRLQRAYATKGNAGAGVYTPQIVVNGGGGAVGSREYAVRSLVRTEKAAGPVIGAEKDAAGDMVLTISGQSRYMAGVSLLALSSSEMVRVGRGENGGRVLHYTNVVKGERNLGSWKGGPTSITIPKEYLRISGADKYAVILQRPGAGPIIGAKLLNI